MFCSLEYKYNVGTYLLVVLDILHIFHTRSITRASVLINSTYIIYLLIGYEPQGRLKVLTLHLPLFAQVKQW
jgi:hypothetical protein